MVDDIRIYVNHCDQDVLNIEAVHKRVIVGSIIEVISKIFIIVKVNDIGIETILVIVDVNDYTKLTEIDQDNYERIFWGVWGINFYLRNIELDDKENWIDKVLYNYIHEINELKLFLVIVDSGRLEVRMILMINSTIVNVTSFHIVVLTLFVSMDQVCFNSFIISFYLRICGKISLVDLVNLYKGKVSIRRGIL